MKALLAGLVIAALIATTIADIDEYSDYAVDKLNSKLNLIEIEREAELINSNTRLHFTLWDDPEPEGMILEMTTVLERAPPEDTNICGYWIGIKLDQGREYLCNISHLVVDTDYGLLSEDAHNMQFLVVLESDSTPQVVIDIPIMRIPSWADPNNLLTWARNNRVGIISPVSLDQLVQFHASQQLTLDFTWLRELLRFGVKKCIHKRVKRDGGAIDTFVSRPLLLSDDIINKLWEEVDWFKYDDGSEDTDELSQVDGLAMLNEPRR